MKRIIIVLTSILFVFLFYKETLSYFFVSDDFFYVDFRSVTEAVAPRPDFYHYNPAFWLLMFGMRQVFGINPVAFHVLALLLHFVNSFLVYILARTFGMKKNVSMAGAFVFALFFPQYEVVYWVTGIQTSLMTMLYMAALLQWIRFVEKGRIVSYITFLCLFAAGLLTNEYAVSLPVVCGMFFLLFRQKKPRLLLTQKTIISSFIFLLILIGYLYIKVFGVHASLFVHSPSIARVGASVIKSLLYVGTGNPFIVDALGAMPTAIVGIGFFGLVALVSTKNNTRRFLFLWMMTVILIFSLTSLPQARYMYFASVPAILLMHSLLSYKNNKGSLLRILYILFVCIAGTAFLQVQKLHWKKASLITRQVVREIQGVEFEGVDKKQIAVADIPDSSNGGIWKAYVFRNGLEHVFSIYRGFLPRVFYYRTSEDDDTKRDDEKKSLLEIRSLKNSGMIIFVYERQRQTLIPL